MDKDKETGGQDEIVATLRYLRKAQHRQRWEIRIWLLVGFVGLYVWAQLPAVVLLRELVWIWLEAYWLRQ